MSPAQRRQINQQNARKSTGPKTAEGKERARRNALRHGLCAEKLALPNEDPAVIAEQVNAWVDHYQPEGPAELVLVEEAARAALRLRRCATYETAVIADQVRKAPERWCARNHAEMMQVRAGLDADPETTIWQLEQLVDGRAWLLDRWARLEAVLVAHGAFYKTQAVEEAVRLLGARPEEPRTTRVTGYRFRLLNTLAKDQGSRCQEFLDELLSDEMRPAEYLACYDRALPDQAAARAELKKMVRNAIERLERLSAAAAAVVLADYDEAQARALILEAGPQSALLVRYQGAAQSSFHRSLKALTTLQADRHAAEADVNTLTPSPAPAPNEANPPAEPNSSADGVKDCADPDGPAAAAEAKPEPRPPASRPEPDALWFLTIMPEEGVVPINESAG